jgi:hypothetical protein
MQKCGTLLFLGVTLCARRRGHCGAHRGYIVKATGHRQVIRWWRQHITTRVHAQDERVGV